VGKSLYIDPNTYDLEILNNNLRMTTNTSQWLSCKLEARLKTFFGEWFINSTIGVPYFEQILKKQVDINNVTTILSDYIKNTRGVKELITFDVDYDNISRHYKYTFEVTSNDGTTVSGGSEL